MKVKIFNEGDKVKLVERGAIDWEEADYTEWAGLLNDAVYTVFRSHCGAEQPSISLVECEMRYDIHPNHFEHV